MQRRTFVTAAASTGLLSLGGCLGGGGSSDKVEVSNVEMKHNDEGSRTETVTLTGTIKNVSKNPVTPTVTVTFLRKGQTLNPVEKKPGKIQSDSTKEFEAESVEMGRTASQIDGYKLEISTNGSSYTTQSTQTSE